MLYLFYNVLTAHSCLKGFQQGQLNNIKNYENVNIIDVFHFHVLPKTIVNCKTGILFCVNSII